MVSVSNVVIASLTFLGIPISFFGIVGALYELIDSNSNCNDGTSPMYAVGIGIFILIMSMAGLIGAMWERRGMLLTFLWMMFFLIAGCVGYMVLIYAVTAQGGSAELEKMNKAHQIELFSPLLRRYVIGGEKWNSTRTCLIQNKFCEGADLFDNHIDDVWQSKQFGCCRPPPECGFEYKNEKLWVLPKSGSASKDQDCYTWSNDSDKMCYDCNSCKAEHLAEFVFLWKIESSAFIVITIFLIVVFMVGCCALGNSNSKMGDFEYRGIH